jgi:uncharacterized phage-like protein YoqJ
MQFLEPHRTVGITGHRTARLYGAEHRLFARLLAEFTGLVTVYDTFISGMAPGVDLLAARAVLQLRERMPLMCIRLVAAVPFTGQERLWLPEVQREYREILALADKVVHTAPGEYAAWKYFQRDRWIVDHCELLFAVWDGNNTGGTAYTVDYALRQQRETILVNPRHL